MAEIDPFSMLEVSFASVKDEELELDSSPPADRPGQGARTRKAKVMAEGIETIDIPNDSPFHVPLMFGWRREVVLRLNSSSSKADVYYIPPQGKKCRSLRDVEKLIQGTQLTLDGFTFVKKLLGVNDPSKELLRSASNVMPFKKTGSSDSGDTTSSPPHKRVKMTLKHAKVKPELQTEERPDVTGELIRLPINASYTPLDGIATLSADERNDIVEAMTEDMTMAERMMRIFS
uniref:MBD domain-containing protein n=1 Tax=Lygus hesperus TaxID=30085 RepID=A0A146LQC4_LYGHE